jgi:hypothetical protein
MGGDFTSSLSTDLRRDLQQLVEEPGQLSGTALGYGLDDRGLESRQELRIYLFTTASRPALGSTKSPYKHQWLFPWV